MSEPEPDARDWRRELDAEDPEVRAEAVVRLARLEGTRAEQEVVARLGDRSLLVRVAAVAALWETTGRLRNPEAVVDGLHADDENTRAAAVEALSAIGSALLPALRKAFEASGERDAVYPRALGEIPAIEARKELERLARESGAEVAEEAHKALGEGRR